MSQGDDKMIVRGLAKDGGPSCRLDRLSGSGLVWHQHSKSLAVCISCSFDNLGILARKISGEAVMKAAF